MGVFHGWLGAMFYYTVVNRDPFQEVFLKFSVSFAVGFILLIILSNVICHNLYFQLLKTYSVTFLLFTDFISDFSYNIL